jgi:hypothetical protein
VTQALEVAQFADRDRVPEVQLRHGGVEALFHDPGLVGLERALQLAFQLLEGDDLVRAFAQDLDLFVWGEHSALLGRIGLRSQEARS